MKHHDLQSLNNKKDDCPSCHSNQQQNTNHKILPFLRVALTGIFLALSWLAGFLNWRLTFVPNHWQYLEDLFAILAIAIGWWPILKNAIKTIWAKNLNVNVLVSIAVIAALCVNAHKEAAIVIFIMLLGEFLEEFTTRKASLAVEKLMAITPKQIRVKRHGKEILLPIKEVKLNDIVVARPGERLGVDGLLLTDIAQLDQSIITGESKPIIKKKGEKIPAGSISDGSYLEIKVTQIGEDTTLSRIQKLVKEAQNSKAPIQKTVDKFAKYFVPAVLVVALATGLLTADIFRAITILIVACPCALIIATPISMVAGIGRGAKRGILIKGGEYLEALGKIDTIIFDKTGTLTLGQPKVLEIKKFLDHTEKEIIEIAATLESQSEHHLANAILEKAKELGVQPKIPKEIRIIKGQGVVGKYNQHFFYLGNMSLMRANNINLPPNIANYIQQEEQKNHTTVIVAHHQKVCGVICLSDKLRKEAKETIKRLRKLGVEEIFMLTGDNKSVAQNIVTKLKINKFFAKMLPQDKVNQIKKLQKDGKRVIMVGDGINDAPSLAQADVGIAMGLGTDIAIESGDIVLMKNELLKIPEIIKLGRSSLLIIKQNLTFAIGFNFVMLALAGLGIINMIDGAIFHQASSLFVILNAMRILLVK